MSRYRCTVSVWTNYKSRVNPYRWGMAESLVDFHPWKTNSLELSTSLPFCLCWPCRVQLIDKGFCPCHQGLMSFCQLPGSPVPHSALLFFFSSIPDRSLSPSLLFSPPPHLPVPNTIHSPSPRDIHSYHCASRHSLKVIVSIRAPSLKSHRHHLIKLYEGDRLVNPISFLSAAHTHIRASQEEHYIVHCCNIQSHQMCYSCMHKYAPSPFKHTCAHTAISLFRRPPPQYSCDCVSCGLTPRVH